MNHLTAVVGAGPSGLMPGSGLRSRRAAVMVLKGCCAVGGRGSTRGLIVAELQSTGRQPVTDGRS